MEAPHVLCLFFLISKTLGFHVLPTVQPYTLETPVSFEENRELTFFVQIKACKSQENTQLSSQDACKICGGTLLNKDFVLTAAHCLYDSNYAKIFFGKNENPGSEQHEVVVIDSSEYIIHDNYNDLTLENDIALLPTFGYSLEVDQIALSGRYPDADEEFVLAGWKKDLLEKETFFLETLRVPMLSADDCVDELSKINPKTEFCASLKESVASGCLGESGSPLFQKVNNEMILYGMISFSSGKCNDKSTQAAVFTNIFAYREWIIVNLALNEHLHEKLVQNNEHMLSDQTKLDIIKQTVDTLSSQMDLNYDYSDEDEEENTGTGILPEALEIIAAKEDFEIDGPKSTVLKESIPQVKFTLSEAEIDELVAHFMEYFFGKYWQTWMFLINICIAMLAVYIFIKFLMKISREEKLKKVEEEEEEKIDYGKAWWTVWFGKF